MNKNYYQILGVSEDTDEVVIRAAYRALAQKYHPDKMQKASGLERDTLMQHINEAYVTLSNPKTRDKYDQQMNIHRRETTIKANYIHPAGEHKVAKKNQSSSMVEGMLLTGLAMLLLWIGIVILGLL